MFEDEMELEAQAILRQEAMDRDPDGDWAYFRSDDDPADLEDELDEEIA